MTQRQFTLAIPLTALLLAGGFVAFALSPIAGRLAMLIPPAPPVTTVAVNFHWQCDLTQPALGGFSLLLQETGGGFTAEHVGKVTNATLPLIPGREYSVQLETFNIDHWALPLTPPLKFIAGPGVVLSIRCSQVAVSFYAQTNKTYQAQARTLTTSNWTNFSPPIAGSNATVELRDETTNNRVYRVKTL